MRVSLEEYRNIFKSDPIKDFKKKRKISMENTKWFIKKIEISGIYGYVDLVEIKTYDRRIRRKK